MSKIGKEIFTSLDLNGPYIRIDTQPTSITKESVHGNGGLGREDRYTATFTTAASVFFRTGDSAEVGDDNIIEEDAAPPEVSNVGTITYQWYEMTDVEPIIEIDSKLEDGDSVNAAGNTINELPFIHRDVENNTDITTTGARFSGTTTPELTITNLHSPGDNDRKFYCVVGYRLTEGDLRTGNIVNDSLTTDVVTLTVLPHIIIDEQPIGSEFEINNKDDINIISFQSRLSDNRFANDLTYQWYEVNEDGGQFELRDGVNLYSPIIGGTRTIERITQGERVTEFIANKDFNYSKTAIDELRVPFVDDDGNIVYSAKVGIPTQVSEVNVKISGASGGNGGGEGGTSSQGGIGGKGRFGNFKFSPELISRINSSDEPQDFTIFAGSRGEDGPNQTNDINNYARGGICASSYNASNTYNIEGSAGDGGYAGPNEDSGGGGAGGGFSGIYDVEANRWLAIAGGGGGGGGGSELRPGTDGENAGDWEHTSSTNSTRIETAKQATVVNFNPKCAADEEGSGEVDKIKYGFYTKTENSNNQVLANGDNDIPYDRLIIIWNGAVEYDETDTDTINERLLSDDDGVYISVNNIRYYVGTHRGSQLGWCDDDNDCGVCTRLKTEADDLDNRIDISRDRRTGGYANSFDLRRVVIEADPDDSEDATALDDYGIYGAYGINGADKVSGDGGGGGGGGAGAFTDSRGGNAGTDPIENAIYPITVSVETNNDGNNNNAYISFRNVSTEAGDQITFRKSDSNNTSNKSFRSGAVYDVLSSVDDGLTSEGIRIIPGLNRSIGLDLSDAISLDGLPSDILVSLGSGVFRTVPRTVFVDGEFVGTSIIQFIVPSGNTVNQTAAEGGEGGRSAYLTDNNTSHHLIKRNGGLISDAQGHVELRFTTIEGYDILSQDVENVTLTSKRSHNGTRTQSLGTNSEYTFSKFYKCRISSTISGPIRELDTDTVMLIATDNNRGILFVEAIGTDNFAYTYSRNLNNTTDGIDVKLYPSTETGTNKVRYYSLHTKYNTDVDIRLYGGKGKNKTYGTTTYSGGLGGMSYFRLRMKENTEYVIAGLDSTINTPFLFEKGTLLATVGSGGDAGNIGNGGDGSGINDNGGNAPNNGGTGAQRYTTLGENGRYGSASVATIFSPGDDKASGNVGGYTKKCTTGKYWAEDANPTVSPCEDIPGNSKFRLSDGTNVINTAEITRGFKTGYNIFVTGGSGQASGGNGGNGAGGGSGSNNGHGGGGGSGYANQSANFFLRDRIRNPLTQPESPDGTDSGSASGVNDGQPYVEISLADVPTQDLREFQEYPEDIVIGTDQLEIFREGLFEPLPIIEVPRDADEPILSAEVIDVYINDILKDKPLRGQVPLDVNEGDTIKIVFQTKKIPPYSRFYWRLVSINNSFNLNDVSALEGDFTTNFQFTSEQISNDSTIEPSTCQGSFEFSITADLLTEFTTSVEKFGLDIYSDSDRSFLVADLHRGTFNIVDISRSAPAAEITTTAISMDEGSTQTFFVRTTDIPIFPNIWPDGNITLNWEIVNITTSNNDFTTTSGTFNITVDDPASSVTGTGSFIVGVKEDFTTEGEKEFSLKISYNGTVLYDGTDESTPYTVIINDTSKDPVYTLTSLRDEINEHDGLSFASGDTETYTLSTQFVRPNSQFYFQVVSGHNNSDTTAQIETDDFSTASGEFTVTADSNTSRTPSGTFSVVTQPDAESETQELFTVQVYKKTTGDYDNTELSPPSSDSLVATKNLAVNNTTETTFILHEFGQNQSVRSKQIDEGEDLTLNVYGRFAPDSPETVYWKIYKDSAGLNPADSSDWDNDINGQVTLPQTDNEGNVSFTITPSEDVTSEPGGDEKFYVKLSLDANYNVLIPNVQFEIDVVDTSRNPIYKFKTIDGSTSSFIMDEGNTKTMQLTIKSVDEGEVFYWEILRGHADLSSLQADSSDWEPVSGTVTSTGLTEHTLQWTIEGLADEVTEGTSSNNIYFAIRVTTGNYYSAGGTPIPTSINSLSIQNEGRIEITLRDISKAPPDYTINTSKTINEGSTTTDYDLRLFRYTDAGFSSDTTTINFNDATLYYVIVRSGTVTEASSDVEASSGDIEFPFSSRESSSSTGSLVHKTTLRVTAVEDFLFDSGKGYTKDEDFDLLLFRNLDDASTYISDSENNASLLLRRFSQFLTITDSSFPKYAIRNTYRTAHLETFSYNENGTETTQMIYLFSNLYENFHWEIRYPTSGTELGWSSNFNTNDEEIDSDGNLTGYILYRGSEPIWGQASNSNLGQGSRGSVFYSRLDFFTPIDFERTSDTVAQIRIYDDSSYTRISKSSTFTIVNKFSSASINPTISYSDKLLRSRASNGRLLYNANDHSFNQNFQSVVIDAGEYLKVKGAERVTVNYTVTNGEALIEDGSWDSGPIQWIKDNVTNSSSSNFKEHYLHDILDDFSGAEIIPESGDWDGYLLTVVVDAKNANGTTTATKSTRFDFNPPASTATLTASSLVIDEGDAVTLTWSSTNGSSYTLTGQGEVTSSGQVIVYPPLNEGFTLTNVTYEFAVVGLDGTTRTASRIIQVNKPAAATPTATLTASSTDITRGDSIILTWSSTNGSSYTLTSVQDPGSSSDPDGFEVTPSSGWQGDFTKTYQYTVTNEDGVQAKASVTITVTEEETAAPLSRPSVSNKIYLRYWYKTSSTARYATIGRLGLHPHTYGDGAENYPILLGTSSNPADSSWVKHCDSIRIDVNTYDSEGNARGKLKTFERDDLDATSNAYQNFHEVFEGYTDYLVGSTNDGEGGFPSSFDGYYVYVKLTAGNVEYPNEIEKEIWIELNYEGTSTTATPEPEPEPVTPTPTTPTTPTPTPVVIVTPPTRYYKKVPLNRFVAENGFGHKRYVHSMKGSGLFEAGGLFYGWEKLLGYCFYHDPGQGYYVPEGAKRIDDAIGSIRMVNTQGGGYTEENPSRFYAYPMGSDGLYTGSQPEFSGTYCDVVDGQRCSIYIDTRVGTADKDNDNIAGWTGSAVSTDVHPMRDSYGDTNRFVLAKDGATKWDDNDGQRKWNGTTELPGSTSYGLGRWKDKAQGGGWIRNWMRWDGESLSGSPRWFLVSDETWETTVQRLDI